MRPSITCPERWFLFLRHIPCEWPIRISVVKLHLHHAQCQTSVFPTWGGGNAVTPQKAMVHQLCDSLCIVCKNSSTIAPWLQVRQIPKLSSLLEHRGQQANSMLITKSCGWLQKHQIYWSDSPGAGVSCIWESRMESKKQAHGGGGRKKWGERMEAALSP